MIWINRAAADLAEQWRMSASGPAPIRHCPVCGVAMQASKSQDEQVDYDTFRCLSCQTTITAKPRPSDSEA